jgi:hypothetical protein
MRHPLSKLAPALWVLCASLLLLPRVAAAADPSLVVDDDGRHFSVRLLPASGLTQVLTVRRVDDENREQEEVLSGGDFGPSELARTSLQAPPDDASSACLPNFESTCPASPALPPFSPRPPPA